MTEYIERNAIMGKSFKTGLCDEDGNMYGIGEVILVSDLVTIPVETHMQPVTFSNWKLCPDGRYYCTHCMKPHDGSTLTPFCAHCGAIMGSVVC